VATATPTAWACSQLHPNDARAPADLAGASHFRSFWYNLRYPCPMSEAPVLAVARSWHEAMNARDTERLVALAHDDVEVAGPRGVGRGTDLLRAWMDRQSGEAGLHLQARRYFVRGDTVVVDQLAEWRTAGTGEVVEGQEVGSVLVVRDGRVAAFARHPDLGAALHAAGLGPSDAVAPG
jgi:ketosteroid isomerase-like protein